MTGVDINAQPHYPFPMIRADALTVDLSGYDVIAASPPCQLWSVATPDDRRGEHVDILTPLRDRLIASGIPYVIENVPGAPLVDPIMMCGETLRLGVRRHRLFESNLPISGVPCVHDHDGPVTPVYGSYGQLGSTTVAEARDAMGIGWLPWPSLTQAIPPAYTYAIGLQLLSILAGSTRDGCAQVDDHEVTEARRREHYVRSVPAGGLASRGGIRTGPDRDGSVLGASVTLPTIRRCPRSGCGRLLYRPPTGRWPRWCSHACRQAGYRERQHSE